MSKLDLEKKFRASNEVVVYGEAMEDSYYVCIDATQDFLFIEYDDIDRMIAALRAVKAHIEEYAALMGEEPGKGYPNAITLP